MCPLLMAPLIHEKPEDTQDITAEIKGETCCLFAPFPTAKTETTPLKSRTFF